MIHVMKVCNAKSCHKKGADLLLAKLAQMSPLLVRLRIIESHECLGNCKEAPAVMEDGRFLEHVDPETFDRELMRLSVAP